MAAERSLLPPMLPGPAVLQTLASLFVADRFDEYVTKRYPPVLRMRILGVGEVVVVRDPAVVKELFTSSPDAVVAGEINRRVVPAVGPDSMMMLDGEPHLRIRRLLLPPFHGDAIRGYEAMVERIVREELESWPVGRPFPLHPRMQAITLEVILAVVLGVDDHARRRRLRALLPKVLEMNPVSVLLSARAPWLASGRLGRLRPWARAKAQVERLIGEEIADHRASAAERDDILAMLLAARDEDGRGLSDAEVSGQLLTLLLAGHETTATSLAWCFERLVHHPGDLERLRAELGAGEAAYLDAVIKETMRTRPVVEAVWRKLTESCELGGYSLPAGTIVAPVIRAIGREAFDDPLKFRPGRFLEGEAPPYGLVPFGGGIRRCLGASFATMEMRIVLRVVLGRLELRAAHPASEKVSRSRRFTASPARGALVVAAPAQGVAGPVATAAGRS